MLQSHNCLKIIIFNLCLIPQIILGQRCNVQLSLKDKSEILESYTITEHTSEKDAKGKLVVIITYDSIQRKLKTIYKEEVFNNASSIREPFIAIEDYNDNGRLVCSKTYRTETEMDVTRYANIDMSANKYNSEGKLIENKFTDESFEKLIADNYNGSEVPDISKYSYDSLGRLFLIKEMDCYSYYEYDSIGRLKQIKLLKGDTLYAMTSYIYTENGYSATLEYYYMKEGKLIKDSRYFIGKFESLSGKLISEIKGDNERIFNKNEYQYDNSGRLSKKYVYAIENNQYKLKVIYKYSYD